MKRSSVAVLLFATMGSVLASDGSLFDVKKQPMLGNPNAPVSLVVVEEMKCSACGSYNRRVFPELKKRYIDTGIANYTAYLVSFIDGSMPAANAAYCVAEQNSQAFYRFIDVAYQHSLSEYSNDWATVGNLKKFALDAYPRLKVAQFERCAATGKYDRRLESNVNKVEAAMGNDGVSTPTLFVNGKPLRMISLYRVNRLISEATKK